MARGLCGRLPVLSRHGCAQLAARVLFLGHELAAEPHLCSGKAKLPEGSDFPVLQLMQSEVLSAGGQEQCKQFTLLLQGCYKEAGKWPHKGNPGGSWEYTDKHNSPLI